MNKYNARGLAILAGGLAFVGSANAVDLIINGSFEDPVGVGWIGHFKTYNFNDAYFTGPPIPATENPGAVHSWQHGVADGDYTGPCYQIVDLTQAAAPEDIDSGFGQYTFSAWLASYGQPSSNPEQPYLTLQFFDETGVTQLGATVALDRVTSAFFTTFADGVTTFDSGDHLHSWAKYVRTSAVPPGSRSAKVGIQRSPNAGLSGSPDTYTDLVKLDVAVGETPPSLDSMAPVGTDASGKPVIRVGLRDGYFGVDISSILFWFDGAPVTAAISTEDGLTTIQYEPGVLSAGSTHSYTVAFADNNSPPLSQTNTFSFTVANYLTLPAAYAKPAGSATTPGFTYRTVKAPLGTSVLPNTIARAKAQLNLTLIDPNTGAPYENSATPGTNPDGSYNVDTINFEQAGTSAGNLAGDQTFPGLDASDHDSFSTEALFYLDLPAGYYRFGVNSDDGFEVSVGTQPQDAFAPQTVLGVFDGGRGPSDTLFDFLAPAAGTYSFRLIYEEGSVGASCEFFSVDTATGERILVNDGANPNAIKAYRALAGVTQTPFVRAVDPSPDATDVLVDTLIYAYIWDGANAVNEQTIMLKLNGEAVTPTLNKSGVITTVSFQPPSPLAYRAANTIELIYGDGTVLQTNRWTFQTRAAEQPPGLTGQWDFNLGDLSATVGSPLEYLGGATGPTVAATQFGTTTSFGIPDINGLPAAVMHFSGAVNNTLGYVMKHGAVPNGSPTAAKVNQWTLIMDMLIETPGWHSLIQINALNNSDDGELFVSPENGIGITGSYQGNVTRGEWHRVAFAVDTANVISKFVDGVKVADQTSWDTKALDGRHAMYATALLLADENGDSQPCYLNSVQFRNYKMRDSEIEALGAPTAEGIPAVSGQWDFNDQSSLAAGLTATIGADMVLLPDTDSSTTFESVAFGDATANALRFLAADPSYGYLVVPGSIPNPGSSKVNQYTLLMDVLYPAGSADSWRSLWQTRTNNADDASLFINPSDGIGISGNYVGKVQPETWYRLGFTFDLGTRTLKRYLNGQPVGAMTLGEGSDGRWAVDTTALLFTDNDGDNAEGYCNSVQFRPVVLTDDEMKRLGEPTPGGIPLSFGVPIVITQFSRNGSDLVIEWKGGQGPYQLQFKADLNSATWENLGEPLDAFTATVPIGTDVKYIRVRGQ